MVGQNSLLIVLLIPPLVNVGFKWSEKILYLHGRFTQGAILEQDINLLGFFELPCGVYSATRHVHGDEDMGAVVFEFPKIDGSRCAIRPL